MSYRSTRHVVDDLRRHGRLIELDSPVDPRLELAEIQRRVYARGGPAVFFPQVIGCRFPMVSNLLGSLDQAQFLFRHSWERVRRAIELKIDPTALLQRPWRYLSAPWTAWNMLPKAVTRGPIVQQSLTLSQLPQLVSWPQDGGPFVTLPQVLSRPPGSRSLRDCNLGMYRIQMAGNDYQPDRQVGLHYQIHRGIGVHHQAALAAGEPFPVSIQVGGSPAMTLAAVMPLPEGISELTFAGALAGHRIPMVVNRHAAPLYADADFVIVGRVDPKRLLPEGPFGDHLGYYSLQHPYPAVDVEAVYARPGAIWPCTVVGRPPQEDTTFGELIHALTGPIIPTVLPGVKAVHAVDAAGVHPLLLAIGSERYTPYQSDQPPQELLTQANAILGQGQMSLAKYLAIIDQADAPELDIHHVDHFFEHLLQRVDWRRDLHFQTRTTIDTLDYSGDGVNRGSKLIIAARGKPIRSLPRQLPTADRWRLPDGFGPLAVCQSGVLAVGGPAVLSAESQRQDIGRLLAGGPGIGPLAEWPLWLLVDDPQFTARNLNNWLWVAFTRSNPATDVHGLSSSIVDKHWGCDGPLVIDCRRKPHHAPPLLEDPQVTAKVDALAARGGPLARYL
jgi:4-hydroxy-3-polyprenylbenzoate decarboxylase